MPDMMRVLPKEAINLIILGGVGYTSGVPFFVSTERSRSIHIRLLRNFMTLTFKSIDSNIRCNIRFETITWITLYGTASF